VSERPVNAAVFASGGGSNFQALLDREGPEGKGGAAWRTRLLVVDREGIGAIDRAQRAGVPVCHMPVSKRDPVELGEATLAALRAAEVEVIFLAGYLRLIPAAVTSAYRRRILNVHPALLPDFGGKGMWGRAVHEAVLRAGVPRTGVTVHFVDERYDEGDVLAQWPVPVLPGDDPDRLAARVLQVEHLLYPLAAQRLCRALAAGDEPVPLPPPDDGTSPDGAVSPHLIQLVQGAFQIR
jgi:formyltetrahydrofolate-dependent phosphoribosylglycinamide formyltransferase